MTGHETAGSGAVRDDPAVNEGLGRSSVSIDPDLLAICRGAVRLVHLKTGRDYTMRQFVEEAATAQIDEISSTYNDGRPIQPDYTPMGRGGSRRR
ncbi:Uncharacterised protein [Mycobacteroides abscessus subsp. massiliense]|nr:Uncharacterised protein [Mycobacteroides abscessus subsp. massiliense]SLJ51037.1 Uncharacterised protein [Mycobacteroides abscessus subsp. abscessus]